jgi:hypothetical protein
MATMVNTPRKKAELNSPSPYYEEFKGRNIEQMPLLIAAGMQPISFKQIWERRLEVIRSLDEAIKGNQPEEVIKAWQNLQSEWVYKRVDSGDGAVSHSSGSAKIALDALYLKLITPETQLRNGGVQLSDNYFKELDGELFTEAQVKRYFNKSLSKREVKRSPAWRALMREDHALLNEIADVAFAQVKERFGYKNKMMGIYLLRVPSEGADGRLWVAYGLYDGGGHVGRFCAEGARRKNRGHA